MGSDINYFVKRYLKDLTTRPVPQVDGPGKRASVAVVIRLKYINESTPSFSERPYSPAETKIAVTEPPLITVGERRPCQASQIEACFSNEWTKYAIPEILFIKRASRAGDRWTGHVALPGGKRDKTDAGDEAAAVRECLEEVGLDLISERALLCGALPQRLIITNWGQIPLMTLCPFVYLLTEQQTPDLALQHSEVDSAFWIPISSLLHKSHRVEHPVDVSDRMASSTLQVLRPVFKVLLGPMYFSGIALHPEEISRSVRKKDRSPPSENHTGDLVLWGITFGVLADFMMFLPPFDFLEGLRYPYFKRWDYRMVVKLLTLNHNRRAKTRLSRYRGERLARLNSGLNIQGTAASQTVCVLELMMSGYFVFVRKSVYLVVLFKAVLVLMSIYALLRWL